ncbi:replication-relaxation family protein [Naasia lichenicola]|uniref:Replication-relaxation n=1 Tax=Naasia lichenicola TaxID=2565933 RepID=A0A4S4FN99_9MICO|nr:replication-relaxation family protein [Naasia lichenicola]THG30692.1 hypothetical protein E6C64_08610 [Naasia lichenicola]THG31929.1 hypothetical protein E6C64_07755 [Naasia lichenicola]
MLTHDRDKAIVLSVGRFGQLASSHVRSLLFADNASQTPLDRAFTRLLRDKYLVRIERKMIGGSGAGSGQYVYQLGPTGWELCGREGRYFPLRSVSYHALAVADAFVALNKAEQDQRLTIERYDVEDDAHRFIAGTRLTPDLFVRIGRPNKPSFALWIEVDLGTERQRQIADKLDRYWTAYQHATTAHLDVYPPVLFLVPDRLREEQIADTIRRQPAESHALFRVALQSNFPDILL